MYTGRRLDEETGIYHYRARAYDPVCGRFLQRDPLEYVDGPNARAYVRDRSLASVDPSGSNGEGIGLGLEGNGSLPLPLPVVPAGTVDFSFRVTWDWNTKSFRCWWDFTVGAGGSAGLGAGTVGANGTVMINTSPETNAGTSYATSVSIVAGEGGAGEISVVEANNSAMSFTAKALLGADVSGSVLRTETWTMEINHCRRAGTGPYVGTGDVDGPSTGGGGSPTGPVTPTSGHKLRGEFATVRGPSFADAVTGSVVRKMNEGVMKLGAYIAEAASILEGMWPF
jgi:RHS repeat-associated protein